MELAIVQQAISFVNNFYGLQATSTAAQVDAIKTGGWLVTVWIGAYLKQRVLVTYDGTVQRWSTAHGDLLHKEAV